MGWFFDHPEPLGPAGLMPMGGPDVAADAFGRFAPDQPWLPTEDAGGKLDDLDLFLAELTDSYNPGDIEVTGERPSEELEFFLNGRNHGTGDGGTGGGNTGGNPGGDPPPPDPDPYSACDDRKADTLAQSINDEIQGKADKDKKEYGALIWKDDQGNLHRTRLLEGDNGRLSGLDGETPQSLGFSNWSQVVGLVHSHPTQVNVGTAENPVWLAVTPESNFDLPSRGDWVTADGFVREGKASANNFSLYISFGGSVKEFDYSDNTSQSRDTSQAAPGSGVESGDYTPGASCP